MRNYSKNVDSEQFCNSTVKCDNIWKGMISISTRDAYNAKVLSSIIPARTLKYIKSCMSTDISIVKLDFSKISR